MPEKPLPPLRELPLMTPWYGPKALAQTGLRDFISRVFGSYADQRIMQAAVDYKPPEEIAHRYNYSDPNGPRAVPPGPDGAIWVDYVADTGDGFESTYAMASLLAEPQLQIAGVEQPLPAGQLLVMGGDQAYPYASLLEYQRRFLQPFNLTTWHKAKASAGAPPLRKLFILPGNHDWYDGLASFDELFCTRRDGVSDGLQMGHWECQQHRSYWAIRLPHDWWIWGLDIQLTASVDVGQVQYFHAVSKLLPQDKTKAKIILCIATPSWHVGDEGGSYSGNLQRILNLALDKARVSVLIAGDDHHYARYFNNKHRLNLITSGGGGAYLAPTHQLHRQITVPWMATDGHPHLLNFRLNGAPATDDTSVANPRREPRPESLFPRRSISQRLSWLVLLFPLWNPTFCLALGFLYWLMAWFYTTATVRPPRSPPGTMLRIEDVLRRGDGSIDFWDRIYYLFAAGREQPAFAVVGLLVLALLYKFLAGARKPGTRAVEAGLHWAVHMLAMSVLTQVMLRLGVGENFVSDTITRIVINSAVMIAASGLLAGLIIAVYLFFGCRVFKTHADNGFSSIRVVGYKNFLRMRITDDALTIYPIGLVRAPNRAGWREPTAQERQKGVIAGYVPRRALKPRLIEGPIVIRPGDIRDLDDTKAS